MPAVGSYRRHNTHDLLLPAVPPRPVNHVISLDRYYRSADLVLRQVGTHGCIPALPAPGLLYRARRSLVLSSCLCSLQAGEYRAAGNEFQLYVMLMRFAGYALSHLLTLANVSIHGNVQGAADIGLRAQARY